MRKWCVRLSCTIWRNSSGESVSSLGRTGLREQAVRQGHEGRRQTMVVGWPHCFSALSIPPSTIVADDQAAAAARPARRAVPRASPRPLRRCRVSSTTRATMAFVDQRARGFGDIFDQMLADRSTRSCRASGPVARCLGLPNNSRSVVERSRPKSARRHESFTRPRGPPGKHRRLRHISLGRHLAEVELRQYAAATFRLDRDPFGGQKRLVVGRQRAAASRHCFGRIGPVCPARRIEKIAALAQPRDQCGSDRRGQQILVPAAIAVAFARAGQRQIAQSRAGSWCRATCARCRCGRAAQQRFDALPRAASP